PNEEGVSGDADIWYVTREGGDWSRPLRLGHPVNSPYNDFGGTITTDGTMYFSSDRPGGKGGADVYYIRYPHDEYSGLINLGLAVNTSAEEYVVCVAGDESYMIIRRFDRHNEVQNGLYVSYMDAQDGWTVAKSMGDYFKVLNATDAHVSGDGNHLFFLSQGNAVYWVNTGIIDYLKDEDLEISRRLINTMCSEDLQTAVLTYWALKEKHAVYLDINEYLLNQRGHQLLDLEHFADAIALFKIIVALFPRSWNAYDSLGEAFFAFGHMAEAVKCYGRSLELNPRNENAVMMLERIRAIHHH
ncbi:MAG: hypothetical protein PVH23_01220, partial [candidate division WOR-3 bacterium]